jgi:tetratricopeptide (TPR) repeat protein
MKRICLLQSCGATAIAVSLMLVPLAGRSADLAYDSGGSGVAERYVADADRADYHGRYTEAIADDGKALAISPNFGRAYMDRAAHYTSAGRYDEALADLARVTAMHPNDMGVAIERITIELRRGDGAGALADIKRSANLPLHSFWHQPQESPGHNDYANGLLYSSTDQTAAMIYALSSIAEQLQHMDDASLADLSAMLKIVHEHPWHLLADHCYVAAIAGLLETAELTCEQAIEQNAHDIGQYDSLGFVHLRMKAWDKAIADYNRALSSRPDLTLSLYGRGIAKRARGDIAGGDADIAAAKKSEPDIANIMKRLGAPVI